MISTTSTLDRSLNLKMLLRRLRWMTHPITIFVALQFVWLAITLIWVVWFVGQQEAIADLARTFGREYFDSRISLAILVVGCVLLGVLLVGTIMLFVFYQRQNSASQQQRTFVSSVTHELKSPLASLQLAIETMDAHKLDETTSKRMIGIIQSDLERLRRLVDQILVAGRLDRGIMAEEDLKILRPLEIIEKTRDNLSYLDKSLASRLTIDCPPNLEILSSRSVMVMILNNLLENAIKYSNRNTPIRIKVQLINRDVHIEISDEGLGLEPKEKKRVFKMFYRNDSAIKKAIPGTGLGLFIVRTAVRALGGRVWAESQGRNQGSTFNVVLPAAPNAVRRIYG